MEKDFFSNVFRVHGEPMHIQKYYAYELVLTGIRSICGERLCWLPQYDEIVDWLHDNKRKGLLFLGDSGCGKSLLCRDVLPDILNHGRPYSDPCCGVMSAYELSYSREVPDYSDCLMIDDIGVESDYSHYGVRNNVLCEIVDNVESRRKLLILTSNLTLEEMTAKYGRRTFDRIMSMCRVVVVRGETFRLNAKGSPPPVCHRSYGIDFGTVEEASAFETEQDSYYDALDHGRLDSNEDDWPEMRERQPLKLYKGKLYALLKYNWEKIENDERG